MDLDALASSYRRAIEKWPDAATLNASYLGLGSSLSRGGHGLTEHVKAFLECVCRTVLVEFDRPEPTGEPTTTQLLVCAFEAVGVKNSRRGNKIDRVLGALNKLADALADVRNEDGPVAHGKDGFLDNVGEDHARVFLAAGDAILSLLLNALEGKHPRIDVTREPYARFPHLHDRIDAAVGLRAEVDSDGDTPVLVISIIVGNEQEIPLRVEASRLLYGLDRAAYVDVLSSVAEAERDAAADTEEVVEGQTDVPVPSGHELRPPADLVSLAGQHDGPMSPLQTGVIEVLAAEGWDPALAVGDVRLVESLVLTIRNNLGVDWETSPVLRPRLKVACKRLFVRFGADSKRAAASADRLLAWLVTHARVLEEAAVS